MLQRKSWFLPRILRTTCKSFFIVPMNRIFTRFGHIPTKFENLLKTVVQAESLFIKIEVLSSHTFQSINLVDKFTQLLIIAFLLRRYSLHLRFLKDHVITFFQGYARVPKKFEKCDILRETSNQMAKKSYKAIGK